VEETGRNIGDIFRLLAKRFHIFSSEPCHLLFFLHGLFWLEHRGFWESAPWREEWFGLGESPAQGFQKENPRG
jgi:hypothetical protein